MRLTGFNISLILILFYGLTPYIYINIFNYGKSELYDLTTFQLIYSFPATVVVIIPGYIPTILRLKVINKPSEFQWCRQPVRS